MFSIFIYTYFNLGLLPICVCEEALNLLVAKFVTNKSKDILFFILGFPLFALGVLHHYLPYVWVKSFVEKSFKRPVFWGSVKMLLGLLVIGIYNIILISAINIFVYPAFWFWFMYFFIAPTLSGVVAYHYVRRLKRYTRLQVLRNEDLSSFYEERQQCQAAIRQLIPVA